MNLERKITNKIITAAISKYFTQEEITDCMHDLKSKVSDGHNFSFSIIHYPKKFETDSEIYELRLFYEEKETDKEYIERLRLYLSDYEKNLKKIKIILNGINENEKV